MRALILSISSASLTVAAAHVDRHTIVRKILNVLLISLGCNDIDANHSPLNFVVVARM